MKTIQNQTFDEERAFYGQQNTAVINCRFEGEADGESAFKECENILLDKAFFDLRYPFWHDSVLKIVNSELTPNCRAALWYSDHIQIENTKLHGIKALRECRDVKMNGCDILSPEFGWSTENLTMENSNAESEYFLMRTKNVHLKNVHFKGKYSFQYTENVVIENCVLDTKDAFWHAKNVWVKDSVVKGEYLAWYSDHVVFENCKIIGTQPLCYCKQLKLIDCEMVDTDLAFERSDVQATILNPVLSIKNPLSGTIEVPDVKEVIFDIPQAQGQILRKCEGSYC